MRNLHLDHLAKESTRWPCMLKYNVSLTTIMVVSSLYLVTLTSSIWYGIVYLTDMYINHT